MTMSGYEVMPELIDDCVEAKLLASYTPNNGIRIGILGFFDEKEIELSAAGEDGWDVCLREFDLSSDQARKLGEALIRWADDNHGFPHQ